MRRLRCYIKVLAVVLMIGAVSVAYGREMLLSFLSENVPKKRLILDATPEKYDSAIAKLENKVLDKRRKDIKQGKIEEFPFLVKGLKYNVAENDEYICFYNSSCKMLYNIEKDTCVYFVYSCEIGKATLDFDILRESARKGVYTAFSKNDRPVITCEETVEILDDRIVFSFLTNKTCDTPVRVSVRRDTGSVILFEIEEEGDENG